MTTQSTIEQLRSIRLHGMADAFEHQLTQPIFAENSFEQRLQMMLDSEVSYRNNTRYKRLLKNGTGNITFVVEGGDAAALRLVDALGRAVNRHPERTAP